MLRPASTKRDVTDPGRKPNTPNLGPSWLLGLGLKEEGPPLREVAAGLLPRRTSCCWINGSLDSDGDLRRPLGYTFMWYKYVWVVHIHIHT